MDISFQVRTLVATRQHHVVLLFAGAVLLGGLPTWLSGAQSLVPASSGGTFFIQGGKVLLAEHQGWDQTSVLIEDGVIRKVGRGITAPTDATVVDATGKFVYPGMINSSTVLGLYEVGAIPVTRSTTDLGSFNPFHRAIVALNANSELIPLTRVNGITAALTRPAGGIISGQAALIQLDGWTSEDMVVKASAAMVIQYPRGERAVDRLHNYLKQAEQYARSNASGRGFVDLELDAMRPLMNGDLPALVSANTHEEITGAIELADRFGISVVIYGGRDAWQVAPALAERDIPVILGSLQRLPASRAPYDAIYAQPAVLHDAGVKFAFSTGSGGDASSNARNLPYQAALATAFGLPSQIAWKALTEWPAEIWGVSDTLGSVAEGKRADLFITDGDPLDVRTQVEEVFIGGRRQSMRSRHLELYEKFLARTPER